MKKPLIFLLILMSALSNVCATSRTEAVLRKLDSCILVSQQYDDLKEERIKKLRTQFLATHSPSERYHASIGLFQEYSSYQYDSAYSYASRAARLASMLGNPCLQMEAGCAMAFCQVSAGFYKEAFETFAQLQIPESATDADKAMYYETAARLNYSISDYNLSRDFSQGYIEKGDVYTDSLLQYLPHHSKEWWMASARRQMKQLDLSGSLASFQQFLKMKDTDEHSKAIALSSIGYMKLRQGKEDEACVALAEAAMCDLRSSTKETTALCSLAELIYQSHDVRRATRYIHLALHQSNAYAARLRQVQVGSVLPIIEQERNEMLVKQRSRLVFFLACVLLMTAVIAVLGWQAVRKSRKLKEANQQIASRNEMLMQANNELELTNAKLKEADKIKAEYIGSSFYSNSVYMDKLEKIFTTLSRKVVAHKYDDLREMLGGRLLKEERSNLFANFDNTFIHIFPTFIEEYNQLFPPEEQPKTRNGEQLNSEMRIFALIRMGINDVEHIAQFLGKSVNTINTYKSRVKNKSLVKNEEFEARIMQIGNGR